MKNDSHFLLGKGADPYVLVWEGCYYLIESFDNEITIRRSPNVEGLAKAPKEVVFWEAEKDIYHKKQLWAPELHLVNGVWTIVVAASRGKNPSHRSIVLTSTTESIYGPYKVAGLASTIDDTWAIDMTYLEHDGVLYGIWSGCGNQNERQRQNLYIAEMNSASQMRSERVCISSPEYLWETSVCAINEGPQIIRRNGALTGIIYSANASWSSEYTQGFLLYKGGEVMNPNSWQKLPEPVADSNIGHLSFFRHHETGEDWVAYHQKTKEKFGWNDRVIKAGPVKWGVNEIPNLRFSKENSE